MKRDDAALSVNTELSYLSNNKYMYIKVRRWEAFFDELGQQRGIRR